MAIGGLFGTIVALFAISGLLLYYFNDKLISFSIMTNKELIQKIEEEHQKFLSKLALLQEEQNRVIALYRKKLEELKIADIKKQLQ